MEGFIIIGVFAVIFRGIAIFRRNRKNLRRSGDGEDAEAGWFLSGDFACLDAGHQPSCLNSARHGGINDEQHKGGF